MYKMMSLQGRFLLDSSCVSSRMMSLNLFWRPEIFSERAVSGGGSEDGDDGEAGGEGCGGGEGCDGSEGCGCVVMPVR